MNPNVDARVRDFDYDTYIQTLQTSLPCRDRGRRGCRCSAAGRAATPTTSPPVPADVMSLDDAEADFYEAPIGGYICDEALYGFPQEFNIEYGATLVNTEMAAAAGVDPTAGWATWDEFKADAKAMTETQGRHDHPCRLPLHRRRRPGIHVLLADPAGRRTVPGRRRQSFTIDTPEAREAVALMQSIVDEGIIDPSCSTTQRTGSATATSRSLCDGPGRPVGDHRLRGRLPRGRRGDAVRRPCRRSATPPTSWPTRGGGSRSPRTAQATNVAWDFVEYATLDPEVAARWNVATGTLPGLRANARGRGAGGADRRLPPLRALVRAASVRALPRATSPTVTCSGTRSRGPHLLKVLQGSESVDDALAAMEAEANGMFR